MLNAPRQVKWFVGLQFLGLALSVVVSVIARNALGGRPELSHFIIVLSAFLAIEIFLIRKVWIGKNWARLTMLAWFLLGSISLFFYKAPAPVPNPFPASLTAIGLVLAILQGLSFVTLFIKPADNWFQRGSTKGAISAPGL